MHPPPGCKDRDFAHAASCAEFGKAASETRPSISPPPERWPRLHTLTRPSLRCGRPIQQSSNSITLFENFRIFGRNNITLRFVFISISRDIPLPPRTPRLRSNRHEHHHGKGDFAVHRRRRQRHGIQHADRLKNRAGPPSPGGPEPETVRRVALPDRAIRSSTACRCGCGAFPQSHEAQRGAASCPTAH